MIFIWLNPCLLPFDLFMRPHNWQVIRKMCIALMKTGYRFAVWIFASSYFLGIGDFWGIEKNRSQKKKTRINCKKSPGAVKRIEIGTLPTRTSMTKRNKRTKRPVTTSCRISRYSELLIPILGQHLCCEAFLFNTIYNVNPLVWLSSVFRDKKHGAS